MRSRGRRFVQHDVPCFFFAHIPGNIPYTHNDMDDLFLRELRRVCRAEHRPFPVAHFVFVPFDAGTDITGAGVHNDIVIVVLGFAVFRDDGAVAAVQRLKMEIHSRARGVHIAHFRVQCGRISAVVGNDEVIRTIGAHGKIRGIAVHYCAVRHCDGLDAAGRIAVLRLRVRSRHTDGHGLVRPVTGHHLIVRGRRKLVDVAHFYGVCQNVAAVIPHREVVHAVFVHRVLRLRSIHDAAVRQGDVPHARQVIVRGQVDFHRPVRPVIRGQGFLRHRRGLLEHEACKNGVGHIPRVVLRLRVDVSEVFFPHGGLVQLVIGQPIGFEVIFVQCVLVIDGLDAAVRPALIGQIVGQQLRAVHFIEMRIAEHPSGRVVRCRMQDIVHHGL